ncbi:MAG: right-handed parallel beta-helix repeat-containing protein [Oscillospiraceae bacterium]|nr:right-handed parallel beta-helix repeat-containing protein [Oscillospiraceae bacterium]
MKTLLVLTLSGSVLTLLLLGLRYFVLRRMPSTVYYYAWLLVLLRFALPIPGLIPTTLETNAAETPIYSEASTQDHNDQIPVIPQNAVQGGESAVSSEPQISFQTEETPETQTSESIHRSTHSVNWRSPKLWLTIWASGAVGSLGWTVLAYLRFTIRLRHELHRPDRFTREVYASIPGRKPAVFRSNVVRTPLMFGVFSPKIVLPEREYDAELLLNILRHELMHYHRFDTLYKWGAVVILSAHWFNPLSWFIRKELNRACELSCDEMLLRSMTRGEKQSYGNTLLSMAATSALPAGVVATTFATEKRNLKERLVQIMEYKKSGTRVLAAVLALVLLAGCGLAAGPAASAGEVSTAPADDNAIRVTNVDELLAAIAPNTVIELATGVYDLSTASNYGEDTHSSWYSWNGVYSNGEVAAELVIQNVDGLILRGAGLEETTIAAVPRYANVIKFAGCKNLTVSNLTAGHTTEPGYCTGGVLYLENCTDTVIDACGLYGCGTLGVQARNCSRLTVVNTSIYECSYGAIDVHQCQDVLVSGCDIHHHGTREGQGEAMDIFSVSYGEGFTVYNCRIHDNRAQYLLNSSFTKNALFLSNEVLSNDFAAKVFTFQQYGATVDGCRFEGNDVSRGWYAGSGIYAADIEGNVLEGTDLTEMTLRDIPPESVTPMPATLAQAAEVPAGDEVLVKTVDEFLASLGPDRTIVLDGELFDLSTASNYGGVGTDYYFWQESPDGPALVIHDASGLSIRANNTESGATTIAAIPRYADVLSFRNCDNLFLGGFTAGHTKEPGLCSGGVLNFQNCNQVMIEKMRLYGCGILGIQASYCSSLSVLRTEIYECSQGAGQFFQTDGISFTDCDVHDVPSPAFRFTECGDKTWNDEPLSGPNGMYDVNADGTLSASMVEDGPAREESEFHGGAERLVNPFAEEPENHFQAGTPEYEFAASVQQAIVNDDWEALADRIAYPIQFFTIEYSFVIHDREEYLQKVQEGYFTVPGFEELFGFHQRISDADPTVFGSCVYGNTCLGHMIAFSSAGNTATEDNLYITAISVLTPLWPGVSVTEAQAQAQVPPTPQP